MKRIILASIIALSSFTASAAADFDGVVTLVDAGNDAVAMTFNNSKPQRCVREERDPETHQVYQNGINVFNCTRNVRVALLPRDHGTNIRQVVVMVGVNPIYRSRIIF